MRAVVRSPVCSRPGPTSAACGCGRTPPARRPRSCSGCRPLRPPAGLTGRCGSVRVQNQSQFSNWGERGSKVATEVETPAAVGVDPVTASIIQHGLDAAADQMLVALKRTAFSPIIYDILDSVGAVYDPLPRLLADHLRDPGRRRAVLRPPLPDTLPDPDAAALHRQPRALGRLRRPPL